ncbi:ArsR/SmtB family transcription factor [Aliidiomarina indica]|uniref:ArsR/SmtB family transcription factor n=1 Tax=Aliidiomarina indica TaxID=2749147 RepID=UPI00188F18B3|nr:metalloregulator ArsR/SmtB family transcription factor [Aliidiomarina indica]
MIEQISIQVKALADPHRLELLGLLHAKGELCVCEITCALEQPQPKMSRHLGIMRTAGLVTTTRRGQWMFYTLNQELPDWINQLAEDVIAQSPEKIAVATTNLKTMNPIPERCC